MDQFMQLAFGWFDMLSLGERQTLASLGASIFAYAVFIYR